MDMDGQSFSSALGWIISNYGGRDLEKEIHGKDPASDLPVLPASFWAETAPVERAVYGMRTGHYVLPTAELIDWLRLFCGGRSAIEIGAGAGVICKALNIRGTDSFLHRFDDVATIYHNLGQGVRYGAHVEAMDANLAAETYRPDVIIGAWVTHRFDPKQPARKGNQFGPDLPGLLDHCQHLVLICNEQVHRFSPMLDIPHQTIHASWLYSRAINGTPEYIAVWPGRKW